jgi:hypothetical protein
MLKLATPGLDSLGGANETEKRFKALLAMVHPDRHPQAAPRANSLCQNVRLFYEQCLTRPTAQSAKVTTTKRKEEMSVASGVVPIAAENVQGEEAIHISSSPSPLPVKMSHTSRRNQEKLEALRRARQWHDDLKRGRLDDTAGM